MTLNWKLHINTISDNYQTVCPFFLTLSLYIDVSDHCLQDINESFYVNNNLCRGDVEFGKIDDDNDDDDDEEETSFLHPTAKAEITTPVLDTKLLMQIRH